MENHGHADDLFNATDTTILTLPLTDFPNTNATIANNNHENNSNKTTTQDEDDLILVSLPPLNNDDGGPTIDDLICGKSLYIIGITSENDIHESLPAGKNSGGVGVSGSIEPVAARLIVEGNSYDLTRVETSNSYIVVPPIHKGSAVDINGTYGRSNKRQKIDRGSGNTDVKKMVTRPARSIGPVPGEESPSCFFLEPLLLKPGHTGRVLREALSRWVYDPFDPLTTSSGCVHEKETSIFGYTIPELAHICRTSRSEIEHAIHNRVFGAEDALVALPSNEMASIRYGMLSEEGRQTVSMAILSVLLESDLDLVWKCSTPSSKREVHGKGMQISLLMEDIRSHWHRVEGAEISHKGQSQVKNPYLSDSQTCESQSESKSGTSSNSTITSTSLHLRDEVIWHCLRPMLDYAGMNAKDMIPDRAQLLPDQVARLAAHHVFLAGMPRSSVKSSRSAEAVSAPCWQEEELVEEWAMRLPSITSGYEPRTELLKGIAISEVTGVDMDGEAQQGTLWQYFPEAGLPLVLSQRIKSMFAKKKIWTLEEAVPYLEKILSGARIGDLEGLRSTAADVLGKCAKAIHITEKDGYGVDVSVTKYVALPN